MALLSLILLARLTHTWAVVADGKFQVVISTDSDSLLRSKWVYVWQAIGPTVAKYVRAGRKRKRKVYVFRASSIRRSESMLVIYLFQLHPLLETICLFEVMDEPASSVGDAVFAMPVGVYRSSSFALLRNQSHQPA